MSGQTTPISEFDWDDSKPVFDQVVELDEPVVMRGLADAWPLVAASRRSPEAALSYLREFYRDAQVLGCFGPADIDGRLHYNEGLTDTNFEQVRTDFPSLEESIRARLEGTDTGTVYMGSTAIEHCFPGLQADNSLAQGERRASVRIWLGTRTTVAAHYDVLQNIACVAGGRRRFTLIPPHQLPNLYVGPMELTPAGQQVSLVDLRRPDFERFPRVRDALAEAQVTELNAGDAIYIPSMWWHHVEALEPFNILINHWWRESPDHVGPPGDALLHAILNIRDLPRAQRNAWRTIFDHYVFDAREEHVRHIPPASRGVLGELDGDTARRVRQVLRNKLNR